MDPCQCETVRTSSLLIRFIGARRALHPPKNKGGYGGKLADVGVVLCLAVVGLADVGYNMLGLEVVGLAVWEKRKWGWCLEMNLVLQ